MQVSRLIAEAVSRNPEEARISKTTADNFGTSKCREAVRGLRWSTDQSTTLLKSMAAVRANTMQTITSKRILGDGQPFAATISAARAKGSAKIV
jgi:hypothetical protein